MVLGSETGQFPQLKPNVPPSAQYVSRHSADLRNYSTVDARIEG